jgi:hypothetical protein
MLSKSAFMRGLQCLKSLYLKKYHPELEDPVPESLKAIFDKGKNVGILARQLFPGGIDLGIYIPSDFNKVFSETSRLINEGQNVIYEAGFRHNDNICFVDILVKENGKWFAYEVKGSTSLSEVYIWDTVFQYYVITSSGLNPDNFSVIHLNSDYVRNGEIDVNELFVKVGVLPNILYIQEDVKNSINQMRQTLNSGSVPDIDIGIHCREPYECSFTGYCWRHIPEYSVFNISRLSMKKKLNLYHQGIIHIKDVPDGYPLSSNQRQQVISEKTGLKTIDKIQIKKFVQSLKYPLYFLDFETFMPTIPLFDKSRPYQSLTFQYSLHILDEPDGNLTHIEFLADNIGDPRISLIEHLISNLGDKGDIVVYNKSFEVSRLKEIAGDFPVYKKRINPIIKRIVDLMEPFCKRYYYTPEMKGSYSIKEVLPALVPGFSYKNLEINKGDIASLAFERLYSETDDYIIQKTRKDLLAYCNLDTLAMVEILKVLQRI